MKLDILCFGAHPDDVELAMSGTIIKHVKQGYKVGIIDLTRGELGTRGTAETRFQESAEASKILGISSRENLGMKDGLFEITEETLLSVVRAIRKYQPEIVFCNAPSDRHPDHGRGSELVSRACFLSGLVKIETEIDSKQQEKWRPKRVYRYIQDKYIEPDFIVDITEEHEQRMEAIMAYKTQFFKPGMKGDQTPISSPEFLEFLTSRISEVGRKIGVRYGEGFVADYPLKINDINTLI